MINFKTLMASVLLAGMATQATFAQESGEKKADYPYVFVGVQGGGQVTFTNYDAKKLITPIGAVSVGGMFTPVVGARLHVSGINEKGGLKSLGKTFDYKFVTSNIDLMVNLCNAAAAKLEQPGLLFQHGDVRTYAPEQIDIMIALHACDVATDYALHLGIRSGAAIIMCSPCCHKQIRPQMHTPATLKPMLQYGLHLGQQAEMLTDSLRALYLEACGYDTKVFEFISLEHTNKNKMILAVKRAEPADPAQLLVKIQELKAFYNIQEHCLETLLQADGLLK